MVRLIGNADGNALRQRDRGLPCRTVVLAIITLGTLVVTAVATGDLVGGNRNERWKGDMTGNSK